MDTITNLVRAKPVVVFSKSSCYMGHTIQTLLSSYGANHAVYELDQFQNGQQMERALLSMGCRPSVPAVFIGQRFVGGANEVMSLQVNGDLVQMLKDAGAIVVWNKK